MKHTYLIQFNNPKTDELTGELFRTESSRKSKVLAQMNKACLEKYQVDLFDLPNLNIYEIPKNTNYNLPV